jgi:AcrR family transcriptional regulator
MIDLEKSTEKRILEAARKIFIQKGFSGGRMQDIANEAGINKALLHYYYRNKETLFEVILADSLKNMLPRVPEIFDGEGSLQDKIRAFVNAYLSFMIEDPSLPLFILNTLHSQSNRSISSKFQEIVGQLPYGKFRDEITAAVNKGVIRPIDPIQLILNTLSLCLFPFLAKPAFLMVSHLSEASYKQMLLKRKADVADFIIDALRPE